MSEVFLNEISPATINGAFPHPFVWRNDISTIQGGKWLTEVRDHYFFPRAVEISFLYIKGCGNAIPVRNEDISPPKFSINLLKIIVYERKNKLKIPERINGGFTIWKINESNGNAIPNIIIKIPPYFFRDYSFILCKYLHLICFVKNLRTPWRKFYRHVPPGINRYFCIIKILHFNGNGAFSPS